MANNRATLSANPYIHGTSSQTLSLMKHTDFQLMPIVAMMDKYYVAPMVGELIQGGFCTIGEESNAETLIGAPAFGQVQHGKYGLIKILQSYAKTDAKLDTKDTNKNNFKYFLDNAYGCAFNSLNLVMIYLVRLRQQKIKLDEYSNAIALLKQRLDATVQFYYFVLCIDKHIFINTEEMRKFEHENKLVDTYFGLLDYIEHFFSFEKCIEKIISNNLDIEEIYHSPTPEKITGLLNLFKIHQNCKEMVKRGSRDPLDEFKATRDYDFFTSDRSCNSLTESKYAERIQVYFFSNNSGFSFASYLAKHSSSKSEISVNFEESHPRIEAHIKALKDRIQLCNTLLDAKDEDILPYNMRDELITHPFPIIFVTEAKEIQKYSVEYRSRVPLQLGKKILLVATDNKKNQKRVRDYLQENNVGPVEVLLFMDLYLCHHLATAPDTSYFDTFANNDLITAFELAKQQNCADQLSKLYRTLAELNEMRYRFKGTNKDVYNKLSDLFNTLQNTILNQDKTQINFHGIHQAIEKNKDENYALYATHRGVLAKVDTALTVLASLIVFYPIVYALQKYWKSTYTFLAPKTITTIDNALVATNEALRMPEAKRS